MCLIQETPNGGAIGFKSFSHPILEKIMQSSPHVGYADFHEILCVDESW
jgi:hypothetical protein